MYGANDTITIWNKWKNPTTKKDERYRHVVPNCGWEVELLRSMQGTGAVVGNVYNLVIDKNKDYLPYREWAELSPEGKSASFTLRAGDLIAYDAVDTEITGVSPYTEAEVKASLAPDAFTIKAFTDATQDYKLGPHYEVSGV